MLLKMVITTEDTSQSDQIKTVIMPSESKRVISTLNKNLPSLLWKKKIHFAHIFN